MTKTAILVDGGFYKYRARYLFGEKSPAERAEELERYCMAHLRSGKHSAELYRIFYYDCPPLSKKVYHPFLKKQEDFSKTPYCIWMNEFLEELKKKRKFALRLGKLSDEQSGYLLTKETIKKLCSGRQSFDKLTESDFKIDIVQKGVDMKIGVDIASLAYKQQVNQIISISGDSDFVPAAKLARREGIDFILDPMQATIKPDLFEHIDGMRSRISTIKGREKREEKGDSTENVFTSEE